MLKEAQGGLAGVVQAMRYSTSPDVVQFLETYDALPARDRQALPWEAVALAAGVQPQMLLGGIILAMREHNANLVRVIAISSHPQITRARVQFAQMPGGGRDRDAIDQALGFLASPKGPTFVTNVNVGKTAESDDDAEEAAPLLEGDVDHLFPAVSQMQARLTELSAKRLSSGDDT